MAWNINTQSASQQCTFAQRSVDTRIHLLRFLNGHAGLKVVFIELVPTAATTVTFTIATRTAAFFLFLLQQSIHFAHAHVVVLGVITPTLWQLHKVLVLDVHDDVIHHKVSRHVRESAIFLEQIKVVKQVTQRDMQVLVKN